MSTLLLHIIPSTIERILPLSVTGEGLNDYLAGVPRKLNMVYEQLETLRPTMQEMSVGEARDFLTDLEIFDSQATDLMNVLNQIEHEIKNINRISSEMDTVDGELQKATEQLKAKLSDQKSKKL